MRLITRDPFGRRELLRQASGINTTCAWCGNAPGRFTYAWVSDAKPTSSAWWSRPMCSVGCWRAYNDEPGS